MIESILFSFACPPSSIDTVSIKKPPVYLVTGKKAYTDILKKPSKLMNIKLI
jgi:hypothetical protein